MLEFLLNNKALSLVFVSAIMTGVIAEASFASLIVHMVNLGLLLFMQWQARDHENHKVTSIIILFCVGLTAVMTEPTPIRILIEIINFFLLMLIAWLAAQEAAPPTFPTAHGESH